jgi:hypothetical protein
MSGDGGDFSVYGEAKGEYTRQLCVFLVPTLETYMLELLNTAREEAPTPYKVLWQFQSILQGIPDWNQDKVVRETEKIQKDCPCDYLEELITAVFIAHTKVLSAIRLTTKQKKLQITIPKIDHFLHRVLSDCARSLWTNAYLFADSNSIEKQKNLRQVSFLLNESVLQAIRGLLPVKSILREYLHEDDDGEEKTSSLTKEVAAVVPVAEVVPLAPAEAAAAAAAAAAVTEEAPVIPAHAGADADADTEVVPVAAVATADAGAAAGAAPVAEETHVIPAAAAATATTAAEADVVPLTLETVTEPTKSVADPEVNIIKIETKPTVTFSTNHVLFDSNTLEENGIQDIPFADEEPFMETSEEMPMEFDEEL